MSLLDCIRSKSAGKAEAAGLAVHTVADAAQAADLL